MKYNNSKFDEYGYPKARKASKNNKSRLKRRGREEDNEDRPARNNMGGGSGKHYTRARKK